VNRALSSMPGETLEITLTVPLRDQMFKFSLRHTRTRNQEKKTKQKLEF